jgi:hypothetical protein
MNPQFTAEGAARIEFFMLTAGGLVCALVALGGIVGVVIMLARGKR